MSKGYREPSVSGSYPSVSSDGLETKHDDVLVVVTQAFDGHGNNMIREGNVRFDGFPGVSVWVELPDGRSGEVSLSPIHGDSRKTGLLGIDKGTLSVGADADITIIDNQTTFTVDVNQFQSKSRNCPYDKWQLTARATHTIVAGKIKHQLDAALQTTN